MQRWRLRRGARQGPEWALVLSGGFFRKQPPERLVWGNRNWPVTAMSGRMGDLQLAAQAQMELTHRKKRNCKPSKSECSAGSNAEKDAAVLLARY